MARFMHLRNLVVVVVLFFLCGSAFFGSDLFRYSHTILLRPSTSDIPATKITHNRKFCTFPDSPEYWADKKLWRAQHPASCANSKFLIMTPVTAGLGAIAHGLIRMIRDFNQRGYVVIMYVPFGHDFWHFKNMSACPNTQGDVWECYFEPLSNCTLNDALARAGVSTVDEVSSGTDTPTLPNVVRFSGYTWLHLHQFGDLKAHGEDLIDSTNAFYLRYIFRFNAQTIARLTPLFSSLPVVDPRTSVALPIRGSDKCADGQHKAHFAEFETACMPLSLYFDAVRELQAYHPSPVKTVILTSEDSRYIEAAMAEVNVTKEWLLTLNPLDDHPGTGRLLQVEAGSHWNQFVGLFSTIELLMQSNRYIVNCGSHFHTLLLLYRLGDYCGQDNLNSPLIFCLNEQQSKRFKICNEQNCSSHGLKPWKKG